MDELRAALELATDEELRELTQMLFARKFNPLDYVATPDPLTVQNRRREEWVEALDRRFRYLAADGLTVLRGRFHEVTYRDVLVSVCQHLRIPYGDRWTATELEAEIFLSLLDRAWQQLPKRQKAALTKDIQKSLAAIPGAEAIPAALRRDPVRLLLEGGSAIALDAVVRPLVLRQIAQQFAAHLVRYQSAQVAIAASGGAARAAIETQVAAKMAQRGMLVTAARYGAAQTVLSALGPIMWGWFFVDLGWRAIATNYGRIVPAVFALAQIRMTRGDDPMAYGFA